MTSNTKEKKHSEKDLKNMKVAIFVIVAILIFYLGANFLKGMNVFSHKTYYYAVFDDIGALHESTNVCVNGYPIGKVTKISLLSSNPMRICAQILITEDIDIPADSKFEVAQKDILGGMVVNVIMGKSSVMAHNRDTLACGLAAGMFDGIDDMKAQLQSVLASVDTIGGTIKTAFLPYDNENGALMIKGMLVNLESSTNHLNQILANNENKVTDIVTKLDQLSTTLSNAGPQLDAIINNLDHISDSIAQSNIRVLVNDAQKTITNLDAITTKLEKGEGTAGQLIQNEVLYDNVNKTVESLNSLLQDLKAHPSRYINVSVFGKNKNK